MRVRRPTFDLTGMTAHWAPDHEWAQHINSNGIIPSAIEPFLIKVMRRAKEALDPVRDAELIADIDIFNRQEAQHYKTHELFNQMVANSGYPGIIDAHNNLAAEYDEMLRERSLEWLLGYCEGFESLASAGAHVWVDGGWGTYLEGADARAVELWQWHLAEEYEHRTVVYRTFHRISTGTEQEIYDKRVALFHFCIDHMRSHTNALRTYLLTVDRASMSESERAASEAREQAVAELFSASQAGVVRVFDPHYDPAEVPAPRGLESILQGYP